jgi:hypothetical protein
MEDVWNGRAPEAEEDMFDEGPVGNATAVVNGATIPLEVGANFKETVLGLARNAGYGKFKVYLNGSELKVSEAPGLITSDTQLRITPFDSAA